MNPVAVYVHTPFCPSKCGYCDFNSFAMSGEIMARTTAAMIEEIRRSPHRGRPAKTIFFGGGTPTYLPTDQLVAILAAILECHPPIIGAEITSEANPGTIDAPKFAAMHEAGFNRLSLGAQSFQSHDLIQLGRVHAPDHIVRAVAMAREAGFDNVNLDLMFALPGQSLKAWQTNLEVALSLKPEHLSLYCLTIEPNTRYYRHHLRGTLDLPDDVNQTAMYDLAISMTREAGLAQYEISNFSVADRECAHNLCYWRAEEYLGYGPGAVGAYDRDGVRYRYTNLKHPEGYSAAVESGAGLHFESENLGDRELNFERIMLGIRLNAGLDLGLVEVELGGVKKVVDRGWAEVDSGVLTLTNEGRHFCSEVAVLISPG